MQTTTERQGVSFAEIDFDSVVRQGEPTIFRGALEACPLVIAAKNSDQAAMDHLLAQVGQPSFLYYQTEGSDPRFFYNETMTGFNYTSGYTSLEQFFAWLTQQKQQPTGTSYYVGSAELDYHFPTLQTNDGLALQAELFKQYPAQAGIWMGNRTTAATHYDVSNNIAACVAGRRRFTLFPPEQIANLYPGPLEPTPGGQVVSMVDINEPDLVKFPDVTKALEQAQVAELEAGDVLVYPAMWWHQVEALNDFNVLINYWWNSVPAYVDDPMNTLLHALLSLRDRTAAERAAWRSVFDYYVFGDAERSRAHLPQHAQGELGNFDTAMARRLRAKILNKFNR